MDTIDKKILEILSKNANSTATDISSTVNLSVPAVNKRIMKLQNDGTIKNFTVITDGDKVDKPVIAFISIVMQYGDGVTNFLKYVNSEPDILECYAVTGEYDYIIKICAKDIKSLERKLLFLKKQKGVMKSYTSFALEEHKFTATVLPDREEI